MSRVDFDAYMLAAALFAGVLGVVNLLRPKKRWLGAGAILLGLAAILYRLGYGPVPVYGACVLGFVCLVKDAVSRPPKRYQA